MPNPLPKESELLAPVLRLFEQNGVHTLLEAKLSRKRIDVVFVSASIGQWTAVELKVSNWKAALWQAAVNTQLADRSYVALWYTTIAVAMENSALFRKYGVGIISVKPSAATIVLDATCAENNTRARQQHLILKSLKSESQKNGDLGALSFLPA